MAIELDAPSSVDDLYLERGGPVEPWRPITTGDVFRGPEVPGCDPHEFVMVLSHPCSLRVDGVRLVDRVQALPVCRHPREIPLHAWKGNFRVMPLPDLRGDGAQYVARLTQFGMVQGQELSFDRRIATLTEVGIGLLQQRFFHNQSRVRVGLDTINRQSAAVLAEIELWTEWNEELAIPRVQAGEALIDVLEAEGKGFDSLMGARTAAGSTLRDDLKTDRLRAGVRRRVRAAIAERKRGDQLVSDSG